MKNIIEIKNVSKKYKVNKRKMNNDSFQFAVNNVSFDVKEGEIFGFLGENGAGKSSLIKMITTMSSITSGQIKVGGLDSSKDGYKVRKQFGILFQNHILDEKQSVYWNIKFSAQLYKIHKDDIEDRIKWVLNLINLMEFKDQPAGKLSGGQKRRVELARALVHKPRILFLDEPTTGVDPQTRSEIWKHVFDISKSNNMTVFLTTHYMEEAEICDRIAVIVDGKINAIDTTKNLKDTFGRSVIVVPINDKKNIKKLKDNLEKNIIYKEEKNKLFLYVKKFKNSQIVEISKLIKIDIDLITHKESTLQDTFLNIINKKQI